VFAPWAKSIFLGNFFENPQAFLLSRNSIGFFLRTYTLGNFYGKEFAIVNTADFFTQEGVAPASLTKVFQDFKLGILAVPDAIFAKTNGISFYLLLLEVNFLKIWVMKAFLVLVRVR
jgi:hypothetical protein